MIAALLSLQPASVEETVQSCRVLIRDFRPSWQPVPNHGKVFKMLKICEWLQFFIVMADL